MATLDKISTLEDMKVLMNELHRLEVKFLFDFYGVLQDFSSKKLYPQWLQRKGVSKAFISEKGNEVLAKVSNSKRLSVIIYDLETSDLNGLQFLASLEKNLEVRSKCKVVLVTPKLTAEVQDRLMHLGAAALTSKPLTEDGLRIAFEKIGLDY
ncbi:MAG: response regulator [Fibromonadaceae bacterium]|jgi:DNA-binding NtrC family response regulator|nr:response regulator [Fibromonadaceae bacterium]